MYERECEMKHAISDPVPDLNSGCDAAIKKASPLEVCVKRIANFNEMLSEQTQIVSHVSDKLFGSLPPSNQEEKPDIPEPPPGQYGLLIGIITLLEEQFDRLSNEVARLKNCA